MMNDTAISPPRDEEPLVRVGDGAIDRMPGLPAIFDDLAHRYEQFIRGYADGVSAAVSEFEAMRLSDFEARYQVFGRLYAFRALNSDFRASVIVDGVFRSLIFEFLLGSSVIEIEPDRPATRLEDRVCAHGASVLVNLFSQAFAPLGKLVFARETDVEEAGFHSLGGKKSVIVYAKLIVRFGAHDAQVIFAMPRSALDPYKAALSSLPGAAGVATDEKWSERLYSNLIRTEIKADVRIEARSFTLGDIAKLEVGDVLRLPIAPTDPIRVVAENRTLFWCTLGQKDGLYTVRLEDFSNEKESRIENILGV